MSKINEQAAGVVAMSRRITALERAASRSFFAPVWTAFTPTFVVNGVQTVGLPTNVDPEDWVAEYLLIDDSMWIRATLTLAQALTYTSGYAYYNSSSSIALPASKTAVHRYNRGTWYMENPSNQQASGPLVCGTVKEYGSYAGSATRLDLLVFAAYYSSNQSGGPLQAWDLTTHGQYFDVAGSKISYEIGPIKVADL